MSRIPRKLKKARKKARRVLTPSLLAELDVVLRQSFLNWITGFPMVDPSLLLHEKCDLAYSVAFVLGYDGMDDVTEPTAVPRTKAPPDERAG